MWPAIDFPIVNGKKKNLNVKLNEVKTNIIIVANFE